MARARGVTLENAVPTGSWRGPTRQRLRQVLSNLVDNAIKYGKPEGHVAVGSWRRGGGWKSGCGTMGRAFRWRPRSGCLNDSTGWTKPAPASKAAQGLAGLAIVKNVMQAHGGEVRVESESGKGTTFFLTLPAFKD